MRPYWKASETPDGPEEPVPSWKDPPAPEPSAAGQLNYPVTLVRIGQGLPIVQIGAYRYMAPELPLVGDKMTVTPEVFGGRALVGFVTRVRAEAASPISIVEVEGDVNADELVLPSTEMHCADDDATQAA